MAARPLARVLAAILLLLAIIAGAQTAEAKPPKPCRKHCPTTTTTSTLPSTTTTQVPDTSTTSTTVEPTTTTTSTTSTTVAPERPQPPPLTAVGPRYPFSLTTDTRSSIGPGDYELVRFTEYLMPEQCGTYRFTDSVLAGFDATHPCVRIILDHTRVNTGLWFEAGSHDGTEIRWSIIDGAGTQALRPKGPGRILVEDTWLLVHDTPLEGDIHTEVVQSVDGAGGVYNRVAFSIEPAIRADGTTPITAAINVDGPVLFRDVVVGYWNEAYGGGAGRWEASGGVYAVYAGDSSVWWRPTIHHPSPWYPPAPTGDRLVDPIYR